DGEHEAGYDVEHEADHDVVVHKVEHKVEHNADSECEIKDENVGTLLEISTEQFLNSRPESVVSRENLPEKNLEQNLAPPQNATDFASNETPEDTQEYPPETDAQDVSLERKPVANDFDANSPILVALREIPPETLAEALKEERPQTIALILSRLPNDTKESVLRQFSKQMYILVNLRLAQCEVVSEEIFHETAQIVLEQCASLLGTPEESGEKEPIEGDFYDTAGRNKAAGRNKIVAPSVFGEEKRQETKLDWLDFDDLEQFRDADLRRILQSSTPDTALLALTYATPSFIERLSKALPPQEGDRIRKQLGVFKPVHLREIEEARREMTQLARNLVLSGEVLLPASLQKETVAQI
ncbi:MAG: FliG C-terminal domain-containing protein, partial [Planctomycetia bacterium]|nr:FliG C-terminal domain-containing protein [Planctomycetia bacterium]